MDDAPPRDQLDAIAPGRIRHENDTEFFAYIDRCEMAKRACYQRTIATDLFLSSSPSPRDYK